jgi:hypothetical protein
MILLHHNLSLVLELLQHGGEVGIGGSLFSDN